jgi:hypothetical protein
MSQKLDQIDVASEDAWRNIKEGADNAWQSADASRLTMPRWTSQNIGSGNHEFFIAPHYFKFTISGTLPLNLACKLLQKRYRLGYEIIYPKPWIAAMKR